MAKQMTQSSGTVSFTYNWYGEFLERIQDAGYEFSTFADGVESGEVVLRHDVDLSLSDALQMAQLEEDRGVSATYCILLTSSLYNPLDEAQAYRIRAIEELGHEVALHFSTHEYWDSDAEPGEGHLSRRIRAERSVLDTVRSDSSDTISFHVPPDWVLDRPIEAGQNAYAPEFFSEISYHADSGQRWRDSPPAIDSLGDAAQVVTHPGLWAQSDGTFEERIERGVTEACRHSNAKAQREFIQEDF